MKETLMNIARKLIVISIGCFACVAAEAQVNCLVSNKLVCLVPFVTNAVQQGGNTADAVQKASIFNGPIGAQLSQLPLATSAPGAIILTVNGNPEAFDNLGPILLDRPDSLGKGRLVFGFNFQQFVFNHLDGIDINAIPFVYTQTSTGQFPTQYVSQNEHVSLKFNQYVLLAGYGFPKKIDVTVVVPFARVSIGAAALNQETQYITSNNTLGPSFADPNTYVAGTANGIGDVSVNMKHVLWSGGEGGRGSVASGVAVRFPTGDALNYLGSGAYGFNLYTLASYKRRLSPHAKIAYQWNTHSVLLNPSGQGPNLNLPGGAQYGAGADLALSSRLTASADILANEFVNSPYITKSCQTIPASSLLSTSTPVCGTSTSTTTTLTTLTQSTQTYTTANFSGGMKWRPFRNQRLILYGNVLIQMNNVGLKSDPSPSGGLSFSFRP
jgi:hypothetical protein